VHDVHNAVPRYRERSARYAVPTCVSPPSPRVVVVGFSHESVTTHTQVP
jgi:hypothetical protein